MSRVVHFEISADDPERAGTFYATVFGWHIQKWDGPQDYWLAGTGDTSRPGIDGAIMRRDAGMPPVINTIDVTSVDATVEQVLASGGSVAMPKMTVPGIGYMAYCFDTEGNMFGVMQADPSA
jgi:uncharacterized protein